MLANDIFLVWLISRIVIAETSDLSYNQPKLCPNTSWNPNVTTFADSSAVGVQPQAVLVDTNNTVYVVAQALNQVLVWSEGNNNPIRTISGGLNSSIGVFVTTSGDVYVDNGHYNHRVDKWMLNATTSVAVMNVTDGCYSLFIDINDILYCSIDAEHKVVKTSLSNGSNDVTTAAGNGTPGSGPYMLYYPNGIYVDLQLNLYVADCGNNRIQLFRPGELNGTTVVGNGAPSTITLSFPSGIAVDSDGYLFIADLGSSSIIGSASNGFRCICGCSGSAGSAPDQLISLCYLAFDSYGNLFVTDTLNNRIQKFLLMENPCEETTTTAIEPTDTFTVAAIASPTTTAIQSTDTFTVAAIASLTTTAIQSTDTFTVAAVVSLTTTAIQSTDTFTVAAIASLTTTNIQSPTISTFTSATSLTTSLKQPVQQSSTSFVPRQCTNSSRIGLNCDLSNTPCDLMQPCQNNSTCTNTNTTSTGYLCSCLSGFNGTECQFDYRLCQPNTCWNSGSCIEISNTTFICSCSLGWQGIYCQTMINYCENITCLNKGVCRSSYLNYTCQCLGESYSGRHCEIINSKTITYQIISKSFASIAISAIVILAMFVILMDILKYAFGIDPARDELKQIQQKKQTKKSKPPVIMRFIYVHSTPTQTLQNTNSPIKQTVV